MSQNEDTQNIKNEKENFDKNPKNYKESFMMVKNSNIRVNNFGNEKCLLNYQEMDDNDLPPTRKRTNSVDLYKHKRSKNKKKTNKGDSNNNIKNITLNLNDSPSNEANANNASMKPFKNGKTKKVSFLTPNFITIIDVESYKKFNEENTSKDPFEDLEFIKNINNINNFNINYSTNNSTNNNEKDINDGKESVNCTCTIF
jgi:hypothetical protein